MTNIFEMISNGAATLPLAELLLKTTLILIIAALASLVLARASAAMRHIVWTVSLVSILLLPILSPILPPLEVPLLPTLTATGSDTVSDLPAEVDKTTTPLPAVETENGPEIAATDARIEPAISEQVQDPVTEIPTSSSTPAFPLAIALFSLWITGVAAIAFRLAVGLAGIAAITRKAEVVSDPGAINLMNRLCDEIGIRRYVALRKTTRKVPPLTWGLFRPVIVLPVNDTVWEDDQLRVILLHELAHVKRMDWFTQQVGRAACMLHWFNPLAWFAQGRQQIEQEMACDDHVLTAGTLPSSYATSLLDILRGIRDHAWPAYASTAMARKSTFEGRMVAILDSSRDRDHVSPLRVAAVVVGLAVLTLPVIALTPVPAPSPAHQASASPVDDAVQSGPAEALAVPSAAANAVANAQTSAITDTERNVVIDNSTSEPESFDNETDEQDWSAADTTKLRAMIVALNDEDAEIREMAARVLGEMEHPDAVEPLARVLRNDNSSRVRSAAAWALGETGTSEAVAALTAALDDPSDEVRRYAAWGLGEVEDPDSVPTLSNALTNDSSREVRRYAAWALGEIESEDAIDALTRALKDEHAEVRQYAAWALGEIESDSSIPALTAAMDDSDAEVRRNAARALGEIESEASLQALINSADDSDPQVRSYVIWALGELESPESIPVLLRFLDNEDRQTRENAVRALGEIEEASTVGALGRVLANDREESVRQTAAWALGEIESPEAIPVLMNALADESNAVQHRAVWALAEIGDDRATEGLLRALNSSDDEVRATAAWALGEIETPDAIGPLTSLLADESNHVREKAIWALGEIGVYNREAEKQLMDILQNDPDRDVRKAAARALSEM